MRPDTRGLRGWWIPALGLTLALAGGRVASTQEPPKTKTAEEQKAEREAAAKKAKEEERKRRVEYAKNLDFEVRFPRGNETTLKAISGGAFRFEIRITNRNDLPVVVAPFFRLSLLNEEGDAIESTSKKARFAPNITVKKKPKKTKDGAEAPEEPPEEKPDPTEKLPWIEIEAGETRTLSCSLREFLYDLDAEYGWKLEQPGDITFHVEHSFKRDAFVKRMEKLGSKKDFDQELDPWNRALELNRTFSAAIRVLP